MSERIEGVTQSVNDAMVAVKANVLAEDGLLLRRCEHGIAHPVGHLHQRLDMMSQEQLNSRHETYTPERFPLRGATCDDCCHDWNKA